MPDAETTPLVACSSETHSMGRVESVWAVSLYDGPLFDPVRNAFAGRVGGPHAQGRLIHPAHLRCHPVVEVLLVLRRRGFP